MMSGLVLFVGCCCLGWGLVSYELVAIEYLYVVAVRCRPFVVGGCSVAQWQASSAGVAAPLV
jgi:hypothetical protein